MHKRWPPVSKKSRILALLKSFESGACLHPGVVDGRPERHFLQEVGDLNKLDAPNDSASRGVGVNPVRIFEDGDFVFAHVEYDLPETLVAFEIFRFEGSEIIEYWANRQPALGKNPSGRTMVDGPVSAKDHCWTEFNKELVSCFVDDVLLNGMTHRIGAYLGDEGYIQHNPHLADGIYGLLSGLKAMTEAGGSILYERVHRVLGEGNFVLVVSEGSLSGELTAFYDLFRIENGKLAEHWDIVQAARR
jgi:predicted SnoaL-like aldol condensation-catalyzing enzyme